MDIISKTVASAELNVAADIPEKDEKHEKQVDQAAVFLAGADGLEPLSAQAENRLKRKIDFILLPMVHSLPGR